MDPHRKHFNDQLKALNAALAKPEQREQSVSLFLEIHAMCHAPEVSAPEVSVTENAGAEVYSFDAEVWDGLSDAAARIVPPGEEHSIAWMIWHIARIEDITMNLLAAGCPQVFTAGGWQERLRAPIRDTASTQGPAEIAAISAALDVAALREYRAAVGRRTREIVPALPAGAFKEKVRPERIQRILDEGAVIPEARWLVDYWGGRTIGGLLLMPASRHLLVHLNEAVKLKAKARKAAEG